MKKNKMVGIAVACVLLITGCGAGTPASTGTIGNGEDAAQAETIIETSNESTTEEVSTEATEEEAREETVDATLKEVFSKHGLKVGTCVSSSELNKRSFKETVLNQFNSLTVENAMKPDSALNQAKSKEEGKVVVDFNKEVLTILEFARENGFSMRGHTLVWYSQTPEWLFHEGFENSGDFVDRDEMLKRMEDLISGTFAKIEELGYTDLFYAYDVVNEAWMEDGTMRDNHWLEIIGDDYLWYAFYYADKYAPESIDLYYNDYNEQYKADTLVKFVETLKDEDGRYLIDGIGLQAHLYTSDNLPGYFKAVDKLAETGLKIQLTELDVCLGKYQAPLEATDDNLVKQGKFYYDLINGIFERVDAGKLKMDAFTFWGFSDGYSWRREYSPLLLDKNFKPKYALYGALQIKDKAGY